MVEKRKGLTLTLTQKLEILEKLKHKATPGKLSKEYNVGVSTIYDLKSDTEKILSFASSLENPKCMDSKRSLKPAANSQLDEAVYNWFFQRRSLGQPMTGSIICAKAKKFNEKLNGDPNFKASEGWLNNFKQRHGIHSVEIHGESLSADKAAAENFVNFFATFLNSNKYDDDFVYNADETGLNWRSFPTRTLVHSKESNLHGFKKLKDRLTIMVGANRTGKHKIPMLVIGKSKKPRAFTNHKIPVEYKSQKNGWMNSQIFIEWYDNIFIPSVKEFQLKMNKIGNVLLLIDNAPAHPTCESLERESGKFKVMFLPPNVTALLQPMDQGVIASLKQIYKREIFERLLLADEFVEKSIFEFYKTLDIYQCSVMISRAWDLVKLQTLFNAWNKIFDIKRCIEVQLENNAIVVESNLDNILNSNEKSQEFKDWIEESDGDAEFEVLSDDGIVDLVLGNNLIVESVDLEKDVNLQNKISHSNAITALDVAMVWLEQQDEYENYNYLCLRRLKELAVKKRNSSIKQSKITDYCNKK